MNRIAIHPSNVPLFSMFYVFLYIFDAMNKRPNDLYGKLEDDYVSGNACHARIDVAHKHWPVHK